jgi:(1->4)-alpha-D-glucan 1-alpha-D-glucosylmutase
VDFAARELHLAHLADAFQQQGSELAPELLNRWPDGTIKLFVIWRLLTLRRDHPALFEQSSYAPVDVAGLRADHICAFARADGAMRLLTVAPRLTRRLLADGQTWPLGESSWGDTKLVLPAGDGRDEWTDLFTGRTITAHGGGPDQKEVAIKDVLAAFPVAVLV